MPERRRQKEKQREPQHVEPPLASAAALATTHYPRGSAADPSALRLAATQTLAAADRLDLRGGPGDGHVRCPGIDVTSELADAAVVWTNTRLARRALLRSCGLCEEPGRRHGRGRLRHHAQPLLFLQRRHAIPARQLG